jgi:hypothetical protein
MSTGPLYAMTAAAAIVQAITMSWFVAQTGANSGAAGRAGNAHRIHGLIS